MWIEVKKDMVTLRGDGVSMAYSSLKELKEDLDGIVKIDDNLTVEVLDEKALFIGALLS